MTPAMVVSWVLGLWLAWEGNWQPPAGCKPLCLKMFELLDVLRPGWDQSSSQGILSGC